MQDNNAAPTMQDEFNKVYSARAKLETEVNNI